MRKKMKGKKTYFLAQIVKKNLHDISYKSMNDYPLQSQT